MLSQEKQKIHFVGVGGCGMSGIAEILHNLGFSVSGSDTKENYTTNHLQNLGVSVSFSHDSHNVHDKDLLVVSSAINMSNPEIIAAQNLHIPIVHRVDMLAELMKSKENIVIAGTHGKTTTTSMLSHVLHEIGLEPSAVIGGKVQSFGSNAKFGRGKLFIAEADESDGSFLKLNTTIAVVTNIDRDHLEYYGNTENIVKAFEQFVMQVPTHGVVCICSDDLRASQLIQIANSRVVTYGLERNPCISARNIRPQGFATTFTPVVDGREYSDVTIALPGRYNVVNALVSFAVGYALNFDIEKIGHALSSFAGILHRYTLLATVGNHLIIDDYAHNPKKIETVLSGTKESFPGKKIVAIFQPHRYTRIKEQSDEFSKCFYQADTVIVTPIYSAGESCIDGVTVEILADKIRTYSFHNNRECVEIAKNFTHAAELCHNQITPCGTIFLLMGAGDVVKVGHLLHERLTFEN